MDDFLDQLMFGVLLVVVLASTVIGVMVLAHGLAEVLS
jgi:hypothetical protein